ncbi:unnamed protein product [Tilletia caries]|uniref:Uncharacterized protein n=2 Tax=Tilletia TaxID=13289 RepID=A0A8X7SXF7_9BASI|nr:hypothetical protein CF328_g7689 [Tilletia controversa]KAE8190439.1 hypothetical protein CF336_g5306 [Tilletia laevis]KAE8256494.1 hypothetical protein A4X03_0g5349 [Tilletia caries]KAE8193795.1 hypothetical protein CF335_g5499 [Tilletia laevis]KAE8248036.1 hypothetical protein A4X06_0g4007 [Tilletia controversa]
MASKRKKGGPASTNDALSQSSNQTERTTAAIEEYWKCRRPGCNPGKLCLEDEHGQHYDMDTATKRRFIAAIVQAKSATVEEPPSTLFDVATKRRGRTGSPQRRALRMSR